MIDCVCVCVWCLYDCSTFLLLTPSTPSNFQDTSSWLCSQCWLWRPLLSDHNYSRLTKQLLLFPWTLRVLLSDVLVCHVGGLISDRRWWPALTLPRNMLCLCIHSSVCTCLHLNAGCRAECQWHISPSVSCLLPPPVSTCPCLSVLIPNNLAVKVNINLFFPLVFLFSFFLSCMEAKL